MYCTTWKHCAQTIILRRHWRNMRCNRRLVRMRYRSTGCWRLIWFHRKSFAEDRIFHGFSFFSLSLWVFLEDKIFIFILDALCFQFCAWSEILVIFLLYCSTVFQIRRVQIRIKMRPTVTAVYDTPAMLPKTAVNTLWHSFWVWRHIRVQFGNTSVASFMLHTVNSTRCPLHYTGTKDK
jgi:hypothetical protein